MQTPIFVTAIGTDSGKTLVSAIFCQALRAHYYKPVQAGTPTDRSQVMSLVQFEGFTAYPEAYALKMPASPHAAAAAENISIKVEQISLPACDRPLVVEGAGGVLVPLNDDEFVIDLALKFRAQVVLVSNLYLGSINHTLCTAHVLRERSVPVLGIVFNGAPNAESERIILHHTGYPVLLRIPQLPHVNFEVVQQYAHILNTNLRELNN